MNVVCALPFDRTTAKVYGDLLSQAITGELVGMMNYSSLVSLIPDIGGQAAAVRHAA